MVCKPTEGFSLSSMLASGPSAYTLSLSSNMQSSPTESNSLIHKIFDAIFLIENIPCKETRKAFQGIKAPGTKLLNEMQKKILAVVKKKYEEQVTGVGIGSKTNKIKQIKTLDKIAEDCQKSRAHLDRDGWKGLDIINFKAVKQYLSLLFEQLKKPSFAQATQSIDQFIEYREAIVAEVLAQVLAYVEGLHGKKISIPTLSEEGKMELCEYTIYETRLGDALPCYLLESEGKHPWVVIRGTQRYWARDQNGNEHRTGASESMWADVIDHQGIAEDVISKALVQMPEIMGENGKTELRKSIGSFFIDCKKKGLTCNVAGHSLGGTLSVHLASKFPQQVNRAYVFSAPGISERAHREYKRLGIFGTKEKIINFLYQRDPLPYVGKWQVGTKWRVTLINPIRKNGLMEVHSRPHLNHSFGISRVHSKIENSRILRIVCECARWFLGRISYCVFRLIQPQMIPEWYTNRRIYRIRRDDFMKTYFPEYCDLKAS